MPEESVGKNQTVTAKTNFYCSCTTAVWPSFEDQIKVKLASSIKGYIVYLNKTGGLEWHVTNELDEKLPDTFNAFHNRVGLLRTACPAELRAEDRDSYLTLLGFGMTCALEGSEKDASAILDSAVEFLADRNQRTARQWHLATSICVTTVVVAGTLLIFPPSSFRSLMSAAAAAHVGDFAFDSSEARFHASRFCGRKSCACARGERANHCGDDRGRNRRRSRPSGSNSGQSCG